MHNWDGSLVRSLIIDFYLPSNEINVGPDCHTNSQSNKRTFTTCRLLSTSLHENIVARINVEPGWVML